MSYVLEGPPPKLYDIAEILLKLALNTNQSTNHIISVQWLYDGEFVVQGRSAIISVQLSKLYRKANTRYHKKI